MAPALAAVLTAALLTTVTTPQASAAPIARTTTLLSLPTGVIDPMTSNGSFAGASDDGGRVLFMTTGRLTADDAESTYQDIYQRSGGATTLVSGATEIADPGNGTVLFRGASSDGSRVFFITDQRLSSADNDLGYQDVYEHAAGATTLVSQPTGVADPNSGGVTFAGITQDGTRAFFTTTQKLTADDTDSGRVDVYERSGGTTKLVSAPTGVADPNTGAAGYGGVSRDGSRVFFGSTEKLTSDDTDTNRYDVYERSGGTTKLVSVGSGAPDTTSSVQFVGSNEDGSRVFFNSTEAIAPDDNDTSRSDVYERSGGTTKLLSAPTGVADPNSGPADGVHLSHDGSRVFFQTNQKLTPNDTDANRYDLYERSGGTTTLITTSTGIADPDSGDVLVGTPYGGVSPDGGRVLFTTTQKLTPEDTDANRYDVYARSGGTTTLLSAPTGVADPNTADAELQGMSVDGSRAFFTTMQKLSPADADANRADVYERSDGTTTLLSGAAGLADPDTDAAYYGGATADGSDVYFVTTEKLTADDADAGVDIYAAAGAAIPGPGGETPDPGSGQVPVPAPGAGDTTPPALTGYALSPNVFRAAAGGASVAQRRPLGTRVTYRLSERATVTFRVERAAKGRRWVTMRGRFSHAGKAGANRFRFRGSLRGRRLRPGIYRLRARAVDAAGNASPIARKPFRVVRR